jgi:hypothetical protein
MFLMPKLIKNDPEQYDVLLADITSMLKPCVLKTHEAKCLNLSAHGARCPHFAITP